MKLQAFLVEKNCPAPQLRGFVFSLFQNEELIVQAFRNAQISLTPIWNYNLNVFYNIPQLGCYNIYMLCVRVAALIVWPIYGNITRVSLLLKSSCSVVKKCGQTFWVVLTGKIIHYTTR